MGQLEQVTGCLENQEEEFQVGVRGKKKSHCHDPELGNARKNIGSLG